MDGNIYVLHSDKIPLPIHKDKTINKGFTSVLDHLPRQITESEIHAVLARCVSSTPSTQCKGDAPSQGLEINPKGVQEQRVA